MTHMEPIACQSATYLAEETGAPFDEVLDCAASLGVKPVLTIDRRPHYSEPDADRIALALFDGGSAVRKLRRPVRRRPPRPPMNTAAPLIIAAPPRRRPRSASPAASRSPRLPARGSARGSASRRTTAVR